LYNKRYFHSLGRKHSQLPQDRVSIKAIQTMEKYEKED